MIAISGGIIYSMAGKIFNPGTIIVKGNKIVDIYDGTKVLVGMKKIDSTGLMVFPGFIDAHCHVGIMEQIYQNEGDDCNEISNPITPHLRAIDAINSKDLGFRDALQGGVITVVITPGSANVIGGEMIALKTCGKNLDEMIIKNPIGIKAALGENPKKVYGNQKKSPTTRMASAALLRDALLNAQNYLRKKESYLKKEYYFDQDLKWESLSRVLKKELPLRVHAHREDDIMTALRIAKEFDIEIIIEHCTEGYKVAYELASKGVKAILGPIITDRAKVELEGINLENAKILKENGVEFALMTDHPVVPIQYLPLSAGLTVRGGLDEEDALKAITIDSAKLLGLEKQIGSLEIGKDADIVLWQGHPFDTRSKVKLAIINGQIIESN